MQSKGASTHPVGARVLKETEAPSVVGEGLRTHRRSSRTPRIVTASQATESADPVLVCWTERGSLRLLAGGDSGWWREEGESGRKGSNSFKVPGFVCECRL